MNLKETEEASALINLFCERWLVNKRFHACKAYTLINIKSDSLFYFVNFEVNQKQNQTDPNQLVLQEKNPN